ncbi:MAG: hypothetical protein JWQ57_3543 [Mucilaginibacter sp.]|nr:hypothetical protein [Mucilaginibacter sp.]
MKKKLIIYLAALLLPVLAFAQNELPLIEDFINGAKDIETVALNTHVNILQVNETDDSFNLIAINDKMQVLWTVNYKGYCLGIGKFKNKIVALATTTDNPVNGTPNVFKLYLADPGNGKPLAEKVVYTGSKGVHVFTALKTGKADFLKVIVRESTVKDHFGSENWEWLQTSGLSVFDFDEKLNVINTTKPAVFNSIYLSAKCNNQGDLFISWLNGQNLDVYKYDIGKTSPAGHITATIPFKNDKDYDVLSKIVFRPSQSNSNVLFYGVIYKKENKDVELGTGKFDFEANEQQYVTELITKDNLKAAKKNFVPVNKDINDFDLGSPNGMSIKYLDEENGKLLLAMASNSTMSGGGGNRFFIEDALIISCYDKNLQKGFQQILPKYTSYLGRTLQSAFYVNNAKLFVITNANDGSKVFGLFGVLDINTGKWDKMNYLSKKQMSRSHFVEGPAVLWYGDSFIIPYVYPGGFMQNKENVTLQQNSYF